MSEIKDKIMGDNFTCACGNQSHMDGFYPCDENGTEVEPINGKWNDYLYTCGHCGQVYRDHSMKDEVAFLCYYELHVDDKTFYVHVVVKAKSEDEALSKLETQSGENHHLQPKGCAGILTEDLVLDFMSEKEVA